MEPYSTMNNWMMDQDEINYFRENNTGPKFPLCHDPILGVAPLTLWDLAIFIGLSLLTTAAVWSSKRVFRQEKLFQHLEERQTVYVLYTYSSWLVYGRLLVLATVVKLFAFFVFCPYLSDALSVAIFIGARCYSVVGMVYFTLFIKSMITPRSGWDTWVHPYHLNKTIGVWIGFMSFSFIFAGSTGWLKQFVYLVLGILTLLNFIYFYKKYKKNPWRERLLDDDNEPNPESLKILKLAMFVSIFQAAQYFLAIIISGYFDADYTMALPCGPMAFHCALETYGEKVIGMPDACLQPMLTENMEIYENPMEQETKIPKAVKKGYKLLKNEASPSRFAATYSSISEDVNLKCGSIV